MNRRSFLRTAAIGAAAAIVPGTVKAAMPAIINAGTDKLKLKFFPYELKLRHAFNLARNSRTTTPDVQVELTYDGVTGYGEASMPPYLGESTRSVMDFLSKLNLEQFNDPFQIEKILDYMESVAPGNYAAKASVDIALHDICGKLMRQPWYRIWGYDGSQTPVTSYTIGIDTPEIVRKKVDEAAPYKLLKVKMGLDRDRETVEIIRSMRPDTPICCDVNQGWTDRQHALDMCNWLADNGCLFVEQPFDKKNLDDSAWLTAHSPIPVIADESVQRLKDVSALAGAFSGINIKLMKSGGMNEARKMADMARGLGMKVMVGCMTETSCAVTAASQLAPITDYADLDGNLLISNDRFRGMEVKDGRITLPGLPGIGVERI